MHIIGLTGGIAAGKSTFCDVAIKQGLRVIDTDVIGRNLLLQPALKDELCQIFDIDTNLNIDSFKNTLRRLLLNETTRKKLESHMHPLIFEKVRQELNSLSQSENICVLVIPVADALAQAKVTFDLTLTIESHKNFIEERLYERYKDKNLTLKLSALHDKSLSVRRQWAQKTLWNNVTRATWVESCHNEMNLLYKVFS